MSAAVNETLSRRKRFGIGVAALAFVGLTLWQVATQRDDWPLSCFEMYSGLQGPVTSRTSAVGVSDEGEFALGGIKLGPFGGARLRTLNERLARNAKRRARFLQTVQRHYDADRQTTGAPLLQALRTYTETWKIQPELAGIDKPSRRLNGSTYFPPTALLTELDLQRSGKAPDPPGRPAASGDRVIELAAEQCDPACSRLEDRYASEGSAIELDSATAKAGVVLPVNLDKGRWWVFVRMQSEPSGPDRITLSLSGQRVGDKTGLGNYRQSLGDGAWVWASREPGAPAFSLDVPKAGDHTLGIQTKGKLRLDQVWLSRSRRELPTFNDPVRP